MKKKANNKLEEYMSLNYSIIVEQYKDDGKIRFGLKIPDLPGVWADGETIEAAYISLIETKQIWFETCLENGIEIPKPVSEKDFSGKFVLRLDPRLHMSLVKVANEKKVSLNQHIKSLLEQKISNTEIKAEIKALRDEFVKRSNETNKFLQTLAFRLESLEDSYSTSSGGSPVITRQAQAWGPIGKAHGEISLYEEQ